MRVRDLFNNSLTRISHERDDIHYIGEALPAPSLITSTLSTGTPASVGGSSIPAREDHVHELDLEDLENAIDGLISSEDSQLVNQTYLTEVFNSNVYLGDYNNVSDGPTGAFYNEIVFSFSGTIDSTSASPYWPVPWGCYVYEIGVQMNIPAALEIALVVSGVGTIWSNTLGDTTSVENFTVDPTEALTRNQKLRVEILDADDAAGANLTVVVRYLWWDIYL